MATKKDKTIRVGLLVSGALIVLMTFLFFIGSEQKIFARKNEYAVQLESVTGLAEGNPVRMSGVTIGVIHDVFLPHDPKLKNVRISLMIDRKYSDRIRGDSRARLKKLGLLTGDSFIEITPGSLRFDVLEPGSTIPAQKQTNVDQLISSGEDLVDNLVQISFSMKNILARVDRGEGLLGELTSAPETKQRLTETLLRTLNKTNAALAHIESGHGVLGKLIYDDAYGEQLTASLTGAAQSLHSVASTIQRSFETGNGTIPALLNDAEGKKRILELVENLRVTSANLATFSATMQNGQGLLPRLLNDKPYGDQALTEFQLLIQQLNETVRKINNGEGTAGKLIADPSVYESINDVLIGINESKLLRWLIRSRQESGIEKRYNQQKTNVAPATATPPPVVPPTTTSSEAAPPTTTTTVATSTQQ
ncbi:MAG TPA: MlaD family protein [Thermoanaerobaculia bacterium]|jgi:phospholipid/cholesterol/gamma-HCH transport system substrate-binding protein|nr:MlaD family protein [Thermoanaerobaculia bacterium]